MPKFLEKNTGQQLIKPHVSKEKLKNASWCGGKQTHHQAKDDNEELAGSESSSSSACSGHNRSPHSEQRCMVERNELMVAKNHSH